MRALSSVFGILIVVLAVAGPASAQVIETQARQAILIDKTTGTVLFEKNADERMPTSSMSKVMMMYMLFEALGDGRLALEDRLTVSERAWRKGGSKMFVEVGEQVRVEDLIRGIIVQSGNDASIVVAEALAGSEEEFGRRMTERARELGLESTNLVNATGWPDPDHYSTARDLARLAEALIDDYPEFYDYYAETEFTYADIRQSNRNPLLYRNLGADGLKTGHTSDAGYGLMASAERNGRRLILVINGLESASARAEEGERLIEWGFREFETELLFDANEPVDEAWVWQGDPASVPLVVGEDLYLTRRRGAESEMAMSVRIEEPVPAPLTAGAHVADLVISMSGVPDRIVPLVTGAEVGQRGFFGRIASSTSYFVMSLVQ